MLVYFEPLLHAVKQIIVDNLRNAPRHDNIVPVIFADIHAIPENARNAVVRVFFAAHGLDVALLQISQNVRYLLAAVVHFKNRSHDGRIIGVDAIFVIRIDGISGRETGAVELAFERAFPHSAFYVLREVRGIIFGETFEHAFEDDSLWTVGNVFLCRKHPDAIHPQYRFVFCDFFAVPPETVYFPNDDG